MRRRLGRLQSLDGAQWHVLLASLALLPMIQIALRLLGFTRTVRFLGARSACAPSTASVSVARAAAEAMSLVAGRSVIGARCLGRSIGLWFLLRRQGIDAELVLGTELPVGGPLQAHAWVEVDGEPMNDTPDVRERFGSFGLRLPRLADPGVP